MKKFLIVLLFTGILLTNINDNKEDNEIKGVFISYIELNEYLKDQNINTSKNNINKMISNIDEFNLNTIILQVRAKEDSIYNSKIFPNSLYNNNDFDVLDYFIDKAHNKDIKVYAWINPYRIDTKDNIDLISKNSPAYKYINTDTIYIKNGIFFNPSKEEVTNLIIDGVKEVLEYNIDGLLFDDYFYPDNDIDNLDYENYLKSNKHISKEEYHLQVINNMIKKVHKECKSKNVKFGVSPDGNIDNNYNKNYADVKLWMKSNDYIDFIMPQIYYGFYNSTKNYTKVIKEWENLLENKNIDLLIALAFYKVGREDNYAKDGRYEWIENDNIIMREVLLSRNLNNYKGFSLFRYDNIFDRNSYTNNSLMEINNLKKIIK